MVKSIKYLIKNWYLSNLGMAISEVELHDLLLNVLMAVDSLSLIVTFVIHFMYEAGVVRIKSDKIN